MAVKRFPILPTFLTLGNLFCGFVAIGYVFKAQANPSLFGLYIVEAGWMIFLAMVFDSLDGKVARLSGSTSDFGKELDSLCDMVSFGVAPALIIKALAGQQGVLERFGWAAGIFFVICVALRLARFNVDTEESEESHQYFNGLPSPAAAAFVAAVAIMYFKLRIEPPQEFAGLAKALRPVMDRLLYIMPIVGAVLGVLMIGRVRYVHLLNRLLRGKEPLSYLVRLILLVMAVVFTRPFSLPVLVGIYVLSGIAGWVKEQVVAQIPGRTAAQRE